MKQHFKPIPKKEDDEFKRRPDEEPVVCKRCDGTGYTETGMECFNCEGTGEEWQ